MTTSTQSQFTINGIIDTNESVLANLEKIASAAGAWLTYDINQGKWAVVINTTGSSIASFDDSNIIGGINISSTGLTEVYNSVEVEFPHRDIKDRKDYITLSVAEGDKYPNEPDNKLTIKFDIVNDPLQAELLASRELKQSRIDKVIEFRADYSYIGLKAGDLIDVTNEAYGFTNKVFRIIKVNEEDSDDGLFQISITALEYDSDVYDSSGLIRTERSVENGITAKNNNTAVEEKDDQDWSSIFGRMLLTSAITGLINSAFSRNPVTGQITQVLTNKTAGQAAQDVFSDEEKADTLKTIKKPTPTITGPSSICENETLTLTIGVDCTNCMFETNDLEYEYTITGVQADDIAPFALTGTVSPGTVSIPIASDASSESETLTFTIGSVSKAVTVNDRLSYTYVTTASPTSVNEGSSTTVTLTTTGVANGTTIPYAITGDGIGRVSTALTGNVTVNSNSATLTVNTINDSVYTGDQTVTVTFNPSQDDTCGQLDKTAVITIVDGETAPTTCATMTIPVSWCATYEGGTGQVSGLTVLQTATVQAPVSGGATITVPATVSVTKGNPSTVTVTSTHTIDATSGKGGQVFNVITSFNSIAPNGVVTGTTATVIGY